MCRHILLLHLLTYAVPKNNLILKNIFDTIFRAYWRFLRACVSVDVKMTSEKNKGDAEMTSLFLFAYFLYAGVIGRSLFRMP